MSNHRPLSVQDFLIRASYTSAVLEISYETYVNNHAKFIIAAIINIACPSPTTARLNLHSTPGQSSDWFINYRVPGRLHHIEYQMSHPHAIELLITLRKVLSGLTFSLHSEDAGILIRAVEDFWVNNACPCLKHKLKSYRSIALLSTALSLTMLITEESCNSGTVA